jgi:hypothetical protein
MASERQRQATRRIEEILRKRGCELADQVASVMDIMELTRNIRENIANYELAAEFCEEGLKPDDEPNEYGLEIEDLIDACGLAQDNSE